MDREPGTCLRQRGEGLAHSPVGCRGTGAGSLVMTAGTLGATPLRRPFFPPGRGPVNRADKMPFMDTPLPTVRLRNAWRSNHPWIFQKLVEKPAQRPKPGSLVDVVGVDGDWIGRGDPLCLIGDSGTGKSHLLIALGTAAAEHGHRVRYTLATKLVNELVEAADDKTLTKTINRYGRADLLIIDELGYMSLDTRGAELLFQVLTEREEKNSIAIASNESFGGWTKTFTDPRLCAAIVDRLTYGGTIIETGTSSYRLNHTRAAR